LYFYGNYLAMNSKDTEKARDLFQAWAKGWPSYIPDPKSDYPAIIRLAETCAKIAGVDLDEEEGYMRIKNGLANISTYCSQTEKWKFRKLAYIEVAYQTVLIEMNAWRKANEKAKNAMEQAYNYSEEQKRKNREDKRLREEQRVKSLIWALQNWDYIWEYSERLSIKSGKKTNLSYDLARKDIENMTVEQWVILQRQVNEMKRRWVEEEKVRTGNDYSKLIA